MYAMSNCTETGQKRESIICTDETVLEAGFLVFKIKRCACRPCEKVLAARDPGLNLRQDGCRRRKVASERRRIKPCATNKCHGVIGPGALTLALLVLVAVRG